MILEPSFLHHWKTKSLRKILGEKGISYLLRLWGHAQNSRSATLKIPPFAIAAIAEFDGEPEELINALVQCQFLVGDAENGWELYAFEERNASLFRNWKNGKKGGRPSNPNKTQEKPNNNPNQTQTKPNESLGLVSETDKTRQDKTRQDNPLTPLKGGRLSAHEKRNKLVEENIEAWDRINRFFNPNSKRLWTLYEVDLWKVIVQHKSDDQVEKELDLLEKFYAKRKQALEAGKTNLWKTTVQILLRNWLDQLARAETYNETDTGQNEDIWREIR